MKHAAGSVLWAPSTEAAEQTTIVRYMRWLGDRRDLHFSDYDALWTWSVTDIDAFWASLWDFFEIRAERPPSSVLGRRTMPGAEWFPGSELSYAEHLFRDKDPDAVAIVYASESTTAREMTWAELRALSASVAAELRALGVERSDRVAACLPNVPETVAAFIATASIGAIWSCTSPHWRRSIENEHDTAASRLRRRRNERHRPRHRPRPRGRCVDRRALPP